MKPLTPEEIFSKHNLLMPAKGMLAYDPFGFEVIINAMIEYGQQQYGIAIEDIKNWNNEE